jgi:hypothetical protein
VLSALERAGVPAEFTWIHGAHNWGVFGAALDRALPWLAGRLGLTQSPRAGVDPSLGSPRTPGAGLIARPARPATPGRRASPRSSGGRAPASASETPFH